MSKDRASKKQLEAELRRVWSRIRTIEKDFGLIPQRSYDEQLKDARYAGDAVVKAYAERLRQLERQIEALKERDLVHLDRQLASHHQRLVRLEPKLTAAAGKAAPKKKGRSSRG
jgi:chaperonin cofactor prefoldin